MPVGLVVNNPVDCGHGDTIAPLAWCHLEEALQLHVMLLMSASDGFGLQTHYAWVGAAVVQNPTQSRAGFRRCSSHGGALPDHPSRRKIGP